MLTGKPKKAFECLDTSLEIARKLGDNREQGIILKKMGDYHKTLKDYTKAIEKYERGLPKVRKFAVLPVEYSLLENLGNAYMEIGGFDMPAPLEKGMHIGLWKQKPCGTYP